MPVIFIVQNISLRVEEYYTNPLLFKIIKVNPKSYVEKKKIYGLVLLEYTKLLKLCPTTYDNANQNV